MNNPIFVLTWIFCGKVIELKEGDVKLIQLEKIKLSQEPAYKKGKFQIRTKEGLKHKLILDK